MCFSCIRPTITEPKERKSVEVASGSSSGGLKEGPRVRARPEDLLSDVTEGKLIHVELKKKQATAHLAVQEPQAVIRSGRPVSVTGVDSQPSLDWMANSPALPSAGVAVVHEEVAESRLEREMSWGSLTASSLPSVRSNMDLKKEGQSRSSNLPSIEKHSSTLVDREAVSTQFGEGPELLLTDLPASKPLIEITSPAVEDMAATASTSAVLPESHADATGSQPSDFLNLSEAAQVVLGGLTETSTIGANGSGKMFSPGGRSLSVSNVWEGSEIESSQAKPDSGLENDPNGPLSVLMESGDNITLSPGDGKAASRLKGEQDATSLCNVGHIGNDSSSNGNCSERIVDGLDHLKQGRSSESAGSLGAEYADSTAQRDIAASPDLCMFKAEETVDSSRLHPVQIHGPVPKAGFEVIGRSGLGLPVPLTELEDPSSSDSPVHHYSGSPPAHSSVFSSKSSPRFSTSRVTSSSRSPTLSSIIAQLDFSGSRIPPPLSHTYGLSNLSPSTGSSLPGVSASHPHINLASTTSFPPATVSISMDNCPAAKAPYTGQVPKIPGFFVGGLREGITGATPSPIVSTKCQPRVVESIPSRYGVSALSGGYSANRSIRHKDSVSFGQSSSTSPAVNCFSMDPSQGFSSAASRIALRGGLHRSITAGHGFSRRSIEGFAGGE